MQVLIVALLNLLLVSAHECFNCVAGGKCLHYGDCDNSTGICHCPTGFGGLNCSQPVCGSLVRGSSRPLRPTNQSCECTDGFSGVNCNMCTTNSSCEPFMPSPGLEDARCYQGGLLINKNYHMCNVTNKKLLDILAGRRAEVSFECARESSSCQFQLWIDEIESFYCKFNTCEFDGLNYHCDNIQCECQPGELLCGKEGSLDLSEWLVKSVNGPGDLNCNALGECTFQEPEMDKLIKYVFGDNSIELQCGSSECLHYSQVPGYEIPINQGGSLLSTIASISTASILLILILWVFKYWGSDHVPSGGFFRSSGSDLNTSLANEAPISSVAPVGVYFDKIRYAAPVTGKEILGGVCGSCPPGSVMAIMGGSGAGKTTLLDILAAKHKVGMTDGTVKLNNSVLTPDSPLRQLVGFVDQNDDILVPTQTVYEHVLFSALLRLPRSMSRATKELRVLDTLSELKIEHLKDQLVGKGLSGGEKRRVVIACELVTSPSVLFLDEPTSGLDAFNAFSVIENLVGLAKNANRTIIFTIHQPRSNIVQLFDRILLLAQGQLVFTGSVSDAERFFESSGHKCPQNYNFADYIIDVTMSAASVAYSDEPATANDGHDESTASSTHATRVNNDDVLSDVSDEADDNNSTSVGDDHIPGSDEECPDPDVHTMPLDVDPSRQWEDLAFHRAQISRTSARAMVNSNVSLVPQGLDPLVSAFRHSYYYADLKHEIDQSSQLSVQSDHIKRASLFEQFKIISHRIFKNLHRDPMLILAHYGISAGLGVLCGYLYFHVSNDISGFQNRLGLFFFLLSVFGFSTLTTVSLFTRERLMFMRERANGYYHPLAYYAAKVLLDIVPLRVGPPVLLGLILYPLVGLNMEGTASFVFLLVLTLFNLSAASLMLVVGILFADFGVASLIGCMINLFGILFAGLFLNQDSMPKGSNWAKWLSIYHYAYEVLSVNEVKYLTLTEEKFGLKIEVPGATILSAFGFDNGSLVRDVVGLSIAAVGSVIIGYICVFKVLVERR